MKKTKSKGVWQKWEVRIESVTCLTTAPGVIGSHIRFIYSDHSITVLARSKDEAERKALSLVKGFKKRILGSKKIKPK